jgi:hypothetical protein
MESDTGALDAVFASCFLSESCAETDIVIINRKANKPICRKIVAIKTLQRYEKIPNYPPIILIIYAIERTFSAPYV